MERIKETVKKVIEELNSKKKFLDYKKINLSLKKALKSQEIRGIYIHSLKKKVLRINTDSPVSLYQLNLKKDLILKKIQKDFGPDFIEEIVFRLGEIE